MSDVTLDEIVSLCKRRGFIYQGSEVYGGLAGTWDYGPLGVRSNATSMTSGGRPSSKTATTCTASTPPS